MKTFRQTILWAGIFFIGMTLLTMKQESESDGIDSYGFPFSFYDYLGGKCDKCYDQFGFHFHNLLTDLGLAIAIGFSLILLKNKIFKPGHKQHQ